MTPPAVPISGRDKWGAIAVDLALAAGGSLLVALAAAQLPADLTGLWAVVGYTLAAVVVTLVLVAAQVVTAQLPTLEETTLEGEPALRLRSWAAPWWHAAALDLGLGILGVALAGLGAVAGGELALVGASCGLVGLWFLGRVALLLGPRRLPALWLTRDEVVVDTPAGRGRVGRSGVRSVRASGGRLVVHLDVEARWDLCPRPWRGRGGRASRRALVLDCSATGHRATDLAEWIERSWRTAPAEGFVVSDRA